MSIWKRASLYLTRKKGKSVLLLIILTVIATLVLLCISVGNAAGQSLQNLRETMGGYFKIEPNYDQGNRNNVNDKLIRDVMEAGGIKAFNGLDLNYMFAGGIELIPGRFTGEGDVKAKLARILGNTDSSRNEYFFLGYYSVSQGRHILPDDYGKAVISEGLAERNQLSEGDTFTLRINDENMTEEQKEKVTAHTFEVVGIYQINASQISAGSDAAECDIEDNFIFTDTAAVREIYQEILGTEYDVYTDGAAFFAEDPKKLDEIVAGVSQIKGYDWEEYTVSKNNKTYENSAEPLERLTGLIAMMVLVILVISVIMLSLILFLWMRERIYEIGVYLSIGIKKSGIIRQHIIENLMVALLAFFIAWAVAGMASKTVEQALGSTFTGEEAFLSEAEGTQQASQVEVRIGVAELAEVLAFGFFIVILTTGVSSVIVLRMHPKDILSTMS